MKPNNSSSLYLRFTRNALALFLILTISSPLTDIKAQDGVSNGFLDYRIGNQWVYREAFSGERFKFEVLDCFGENRIFCDVEGFGNVIIDSSVTFSTSYFTRFINNKDTLRFYINDLVEQETWDACNACVEGSEGALGFYLETKNVSVFGESVVVHEVSLFEIVNGIRDTPIVQIEVAEKFGIISMQFWEGDALILIGAKINNETFGELITSLEEKEIPNSFKVSNPYPNPFNPTFSVEVELQYSSNIDLEVIDLLGRSVFSQKGFYPSGIHQLQIDLSNQPSGLYLIKVTNNKRAKLRKVTKIK